MKIFQISDLHIDNNFNISNYEDMIKRMIELINKESENEEYSYIVCCGDIINKGEDKEYLGKAKEFLDYMRSNIKNKKIEFLFVPGNHDLCNGSFLQFQNFVNFYNCKIDFMSQNVVFYDTVEAGFVLINTCFHKDYKYGNVDVENLDKIMKDANKPIFVIMHHTLLSRYENDRSAISNAYKFLEILGENNVIGILHGHTHGYSNISIGRNSPVIGVGSIFSYIPNCNNQLNIIDVKLEKIECVNNYRYNFDLEKFTKITLYEDKSRNFITSNKVSVVYKKAKDSVKYCGGINNLYINVNTTLEDYKLDMSKNFKSDIEKAKLWLSEEVPSSLYYNHGQYMVDSKTKGIKYIISELTRNSTSNRAIIPLVRFSDVLDKQFGHLPGLNSIQFGFTNDQKVELYCSVYLRSLEVNHFLRINLSEIYLLIFQICNEIRSIKKLVINIYAFKAQYKENFSCFRKAKIDTLNPGVISKYLYQKNVSEIVEILKDKFGMEETVINTTGLLTFYDILKESGLYSSELIVNLKKIITDMENLKEEYIKSSNYEAIEPIEKNIHFKQKEYIKLFEEIGVQ